LFTKLALRNKDCSSFTNRFNFPFNHSIIEQSLGHFEPISVIQYKKWPVGNINAPTTDGECNIKICENHAKVLRGDCFKIKGGMKY